MFVTFEGVDWSGKSTQAGLLAGWLREQGRTVLATREPGGTPIAEAVRDVVLHGHDMTPWAEAALYAAARADHVEHAIRPALERGEDVICDRYIDSSVAYQGVARGLGEEQVLRAEPDGDARPAARPHVPRAARPGRGAAARRRAAATASSARATSFMRRVDEAYRALAAARTASASSRVDGARSPEEIAEEVREHVRALL